MNRESIARAVFGVTGLVVVAGLAVQASVTAGIKGSQFTTVPALLFNMVCFFTVQSNVLVAVTCLLLALRLERVGTLFRVLRLRTCWGSGRRASVTGVADVIMVAAWLPSPAVTPPT